MPPSCGTQRLDCLVEVRTQPLQIGGETLLDAERQIPGGKPVEPQVERLDHLLQGPCLLIPLFHPLPALVFRTGPFLRRSTDNLCCSMSA